MKRGEIWWSSLPLPAGSGPGHRRPLLIVSANVFNDSAINTVLCAAVSSNLWLSEAPGNVVIKRKDSGLSRDSVVNVSQLLTVDKRFLDSRSRALPLKTMQTVEAGLRMVLSLG